MRAAALRCVHPLTQGVPVISEPCLADAAFGDFAESLFVVQQGQFARDVAALLRDRLGFIRAARRKLTRFRQTDAVPKIRKAAARALRAR